MFTYKIDTIISNVVETIGGKISYYRRDYHS